MARIVEAPRLHPNEENRNCRPVKVNPQANIPNIQAAGPNNRLERRFEVLNAPMRASTPETATAT
jgi:hypothetical protein